MMLVRVAFHRLFSGIINFHSFLQASLPEPDHFTPILMIFFKVLIWLLL